MGQWGRFSLTLFLSIFEYFGSLGTFLIDPFLSVLSTWGRLQALRYVPIEQKSFNYKSTYGKQVILLIDEYDVPLAKASEKNTEQNNYYEKMLDTIKGILSIALKTNEYLKFAVVTGCLRIAKESIFTGTNNYASYSVPENRFSRYFGFTQGEVDAIL